MQIKNLENKNWQNKSYKTFNTTKDGEEIKVSAWPSETNKEWFDSIVEGANIEGVLTKNEKGYWSLKSALTPPKFYKKPDIAQAQETKHQHIQEAQDNKEMSIKVSSTFRDATMLTIASFEGKQPTEREMKEQWLKWRVWLYENWTNVTAYPTEINPEDVAF